MANISTATNQMSITLVTPPSSFLLDERVFPSLGILKVAAVLEAKGHIVHLLDLSGISNPEEVVEDYARTATSLWWGITATTPQMPAVSKLVPIIRKNAPQAKIMIGGPHPTLVNAALKGEIKRKVEGRAKKAIDQLKAMFDCVVCGDGENAVFEALTGEFDLVDADQPRGPLWLTDAQFDSDPFPARHLIDMESYHYYIDGVRATSAVGQLGCLAAGTLITLASGAQVPIETIKTGDLVKSFDSRTNSIEDSNVVATWSRRASDAWLLELDDGSTLTITSEHPVWTQEGWKEVSKLELYSDKLCYVCRASVREAVSSHDRKPDSEILQFSMQKEKNIPHMPDMLESIRAYPITSSNVEDPLLFKALQKPMAERASEYQMVGSRAGGNEGKVGLHDLRGETRLVEYKYIADSRSDPRGSETNIRLEKRESKSYEETRSSRKGLNYDEGQPQQNVIRKDESRLEGGPYSAEMGRSSLGHWTEQGGSSSEHPSRELSSGVQVCGERGILDRTLPVRNKKKSRFHKYVGEEDSSSSRRVLAHGGGRGDSDKGLRSQGLESFGDMVFRVENEKQIETNTENSFVQRRLIRKTYIGELDVYNITVCDNHSYIANNLIVHNCPYNCRFCGGRSSSMLRRIRNRTSSSIVSELRSIYTTYGLTGINFYDDELNVSKALVELMHGIKSLGDSLGIKWNLRGFIKAELFTDAQAEAMAEAGFRTILTGFESGSPRILDNINKNATREENTRCLEIARKHGLKVKALMSLGHPGESYETIMETQEWLLEVKPEFFDATIITPYCGTPLFDEAVESSPGIWTYTVPKNGDRLHARETDYSVDADYYKGDPNDGYSCHTFTDYLSSEDLIRLRGELEAKVRKELNLPYDTGAAAQRYEHSMGQSGPLPATILRSSKPS